MKIAITSTGNSPNSNIDSRFGRCSYFVIYNNESKSTEYIPNSAKDADEGSGLAAVELLASKKVEKVISGEFGIKIKSLLDSLNIQMIILKQPEKTIDEIIKLLDH